MHSFVPIRPVDGYGDSRKKTMDTLSKAFKTLQYEVDILIKMCSENLGPNCDGVVNGQVVTSISSSYASSSACNSIASSTISPNTEVVAGAVSSETIVVDVRLPNGTAAKTCKEYLKFNSTLANGVYFIKPFTTEPQFRVFCDMKNGGYILFQRRIAGNVDFIRGWNSYAEGFGDVKTSHWLGLRFMANFTKLYKSNLRVDLYRDDTKVSSYAKYNDFSVDGESAAFALHLGTFSGNIYDAMTHHNGKKFSTPEVDNDTDSTLNCAALRKGAFWYTGCHQANLNGYYWKGVQTTFADGINWYSGSNNDFYYSYEKVSMGMIEQ